MSILLACEDETVENTVVFYYVSYHRILQNAVVSVPSNVKRLSSHAFYRKYDLVHVTIPQGVTNIGNNAFACCNGLSSVRILSPVLRGTALR